MNRQGRPKTYFLWFWCQLIVSSELPWKSWAVLRNFSQRSGRGRGCIWSLGWVCVHPVVVSGHMVNFLFLKDCSLFKVYNAKSNNFHAVQFVLAILCKSAWIEFFPYKSTNDIILKRMENPPLKSIDCMNKHESSFDNSHMNCTVRFTCAMWATFCQESQMTTCIDFQL